MKNDFIKNNITRNVNTTRRDIKTFKSLMHIVVPNECTSFKMKLEFVSIIWMKVRPSSTKNTQT
jgi:hypothetical protein